MRYSVYHQFSTRIYPCCYALVGSICLLWVWWNCSWQSTPHLPDFFNNQTVLTRGIITDIPAENTYYVRCRFLIEDVLIEGKWRHFKLPVQLSWYQERSSLNIGERWQLLLRVRPLHSLSNPGGFSHQYKWAEENVKASAYVRSSSQNYFLKHDKWMHPVDQLRSYLSKRMNDFLNHSEMLGLLKGITIGIRSDMTVQQWTVLRATGTNHLLAISGLHISLIAGLIFFVINKLWRCSAYLCLYMPARIAAAIISAISATAYSFIAGLALPTQRALIMIYMMLLMIVLKKPLSPWMSLATAATLILFWDPFAIFSPSFWLSFIAVVGIVIVMSNRFQVTKLSYLQRLWWKWGRLQCCLTLALAPLTLWFFHQYAFWGFLANFLAVPWMSFIVVPITLLGVALIGWSSVSKFILLFADWMMRLLWYVLQSISQWQFSQWQHHISFFILLVSIPGILILLAPRGWPMRYVGIYFFIPIFFFSPRMPKAGEFWLTLLDVGQGLALVIETQHHVLIYDTGPKSPTGFDSGSQIIIPFLQYRHIQKIDTLIISHHDLDHSGGADAILKQYPIKKILSSTPYYYANYQADYCLRGQSWEWDGITFSMLHPTQNYLHLGNDSSCVLKITSSRHSVLLTGDIEHKVEKVLLKHQQELLSTIVVAPHHGSATSSTQAFVEAVKPKYVLFSTGFLNRYHFPNTKVVKRYQDLGTTILDTAHDGAISIKLDKTDNKIQVSTH